MCQNVKKKENQAEKGEDGTKLTDILENKLKQGEKEGEVTLVMTCTDQMSFEVSQGNVNSQEASDVDSKDDIIQKIS